MDNGVIGKIEDGDEIEINAVLGTINLNENFSGRELTLSTITMPLVILVEIYFHSLGIMPVTENGAGLDLINTH